jgi:hypothetical protein
MSAELLDVLDMHYMPRDVWRIVADYAALKIQRVAHWQNEYTPGYIIDGEFYPIHYRRKARVDPVLHDYFIHYNMILRLEYQDIKLQITDQEGRVIKSHDFAYIFHLWAVGHKIFIETNSEINVLMLDDELNMTITNTIKTRHRLKYADADILITAFNTDIHIYDPHTLKHMAVINNELLDSFEIYIRQKNKMLIHRQYTIITLDLDTLHFTLLG